MNAISDIRPAPARSTSTQVVLIVEDDPGIAELEKSRLEEAGYRVRTAADADAALAEVSRGRIDLILLDYRLPGGTDGLDFHARVRDAGFDIPVILVTGFSNEATVIRALRSGVRDFVTKSIEYLDYLPEAVARVLRQVQTEHRLAESEARLAGIIRSAKDAIVVTEGDRRISSFNAAAEEMFRCPASAAVSRLVTDFIPDELDFQGKTAGGSLSARLQAGTRGFRADGEEFPLEASVSRVDLEGNKFYTLVVRDITERKRAEERIREQAALLDAANDAIMVCDLDDRIRYWNRGAERLYGWSAAEAVGQSASKLLYGTQPPNELTRAHGVVLKDGNWHGELKQVTRHGKKIIVGSGWTLLWDAKGKPAAELVITTDVTEKKRLEEQFLHTQRMESLGTLAGGVAHDFNNLLTVIVGSSELLLARSDFDEEARELLTSIRQAGDRGATMTKQLLTFSRRQVVEPRLFDLNALMREADRILRRLIGADVELSTSLAAAVIPVKADPGQIEQVVMNLVVNARDAMPGGGKLRLTTREAGFELGSGRRQVAFSVTDTGSGIPDDVRSRIFEPFFTTKDPGKGTGLGLSTVHGIIGQAGGRVEVDSAMGRGTTFTVYLPRAEETASPSDLAISTVSPRGTETILLAEDEPAVRSFARSVLEASGYQVLEAGNGEEGLKLARSHSGPLHLLVTDVVMPKIGGRELAEKMNVLRPNLKVVFISGYADDEAFRRTLQQAGIAYLQKPFTPSALANKIRQVLDS
jgi:two-component system, cell cycle sensor histidine kinase and response regulator CckA